MKGLTEKQKNILDFIEEFISREGMAPTVYEIAEHFKIKTSTVFAHLRALQRKKQLTRSSKARSISLAGSSRGGENTKFRGAYNVPILTRIKGSVVDSGEFRDGELCVHRALIGRTLQGSLFAVRIRGESMRDLGIYDGDIVIAVETDLSPRFGDIVIVESGDGLIARSYFPKPGGRVELRAANSTFPNDICAAAECRPLGVVVALERRY